MHKYQNRTFEIPTKPRCFESSDVPTFCTEPSQISYRTGGKQVSTNNHCVYCCAKCPYDECKITAKVNHSVTFARYKVNAVCCYRSYWYRKGGELK